MPGETLINDFWPVGVRQGSVLSPLLFIIVREALSPTISELVVLGNTFMWKTL